RGPARRRTSDSRRSRHGARHRRLGLRSVRPGREAAASSGRRPELTRRRGIAIALAAALVLPVAAGAKTFRYDGGPQPQPDTTLSVAVPEIETVTRSRGPKVPFTNLQIITLVSDAAFESGLKGVPLQRGQQVVLAPAAEHPLGFVAEQSVLRQLG